jgi:hypothetical protein
MFIKDCIGEAQISIATDPDWANRLGDWFQWAAIGYIQNVQRVADETAAQLKPQVRIARFRPGEATTSSGSGLPGAVDDRPAAVDLWIETLLEQPTGPVGASPENVLDAWSRKLASVRNARQETIELIRKTAEALLPLLKTEATKYLLEVDRQLASS